ncbi:MAG: flagellar biosynthesis protein FlhB [Planctomycetota bacterium]|nr:flagellar biosynthesis protein FlhB [Planctomycetota bacterium]
MPESDTGTERTELPTPRRLEQAREEGQVAYSHELSTAVELLAGFALLFALGPWLWQSCVAALRWALGPGLRSELTCETVVPLALHGHGSLLLVTAIFAAAMMAVAAAIGLLQVGFFPTLKPLLPKFEKINPITGLKRLFGLRGLVRFALNLIKLAVLIAIAWALIGARLPHEALIMPELAQRVADDSWAMWTLAMALSAALLVIGVFDLLYQRWQHIRDHMMTKQELKEELKQMEGNPEVKGRLRQMARQFAQRRMMQEVPKATVVITNPTHVAVALRYEQATMAAPIVVAKGYDAVAQRIKAIAAEHGIPMVENVALARALAREIELGQPITAKWFRPVAEILAAVYRLRKQRTA